MKTNDKKGNNIDIGRFNGKYVIPDDFDEYDNETIRLMVGDDSIKNNINISSDEKRNKQESKKENG